MDHGLPRGRGSTGDLARQDRRSRRPHPEDGQGRQLLVHRPARPGRPLLGDLLRPRPGVRHRGRPGGRRHPLHRNLEPRVHAVPARRGHRQGQLRDPGRTAQEEHRHRPGPRAPGDDPAGRREHVRDRPGPSGARQGRRALRQGIHLHRGPQRPAPRGRRAHAHGGRPHPLLADADLRRRVPGQRGPRLRAAPPDPPRHPRHAPDGRGNRGPSGTAAGLPRRHEGRLPDRRHRLRAHRPHRLRRGTRLPAHHRLRHHPPGRGPEHLQVQGRGTLRRGRVRAARHLRLPDRPHPGNRRRGGPVGRRAPVPRPDERTANPCAEGRQGQEGRPRGPDGVHPAARCAAMSSSPATTS